jgi:hypothetical protein
LTVLAIGIMVLALRRKDRRPAADSATVKE